jgi:LmbE family N-acetylglucosaminyl deacetylase/glycosyltransferase involved in cell wall biosynthesis
MSEVTQECPEISIVIASFNKADYLRACLINLEISIRGPLSIEVIVVNDGSTDWTRSLLDTYRPPYEIHVHHQENKGRAAARNAGARLSRGRFLVMLDNDCLLAPDAIEHLWNEYLARPNDLILSRVEHIDTAHVADVILEIGNGSRALLDKAEELKPADSSYALQSLLPEIKEHLAELSVGWLAAQGAAISISSAQFRVLAGFDEEFVSYGMEDFDFGFRFSLLGGNLSYLKTSIIFHLDHGHEQLALLAQSAVSIRTFYKKHRSEIETHAFLDFLIGKTTFVEFNNFVASNKGGLIISTESLNLKCSGYDMARYRSEQLIDLNESPVNYVYNASQDFCLDLLIKKVSSDIAADSNLSVSVIDGEFPGTKILFVAPHMDDEVIGCGGMIQKYKKQGAHVTVAFCTSGSGVPRKLGSTTTLLVSEERVGESRKASSILGVDEVTFFDLEDRALARALEGAGHLRALIEAGSYDTVFTPGPDEFHPDHRAVWRWVTSEIETAAPWIALYLYEVWGSCRPDTILPLDAQMWETKIAALQAYRSQLRLLDYTRLTSMIALQRGEISEPLTGLRYAEAFRSTNQVQA